MKKKILSALILSAIMIQIPVQTIFAKEIEVGYEMNQKSENLMTEVFYETPKEIVDEMKANVEATKEH